MNSFDEVFEQVKRYITEHELISPVACDTWIETMIPVELDGQDAVFQVLPESLSVAFQDAALFLAYDPDDHVVHGRQRGARRNDRYAAQQRQQVQEHHIRDHAQSLPERILHIKDSSHGIPSFPSGL